MSTIHDDSPRDAAERPDQPAGGPPPSPSLKQGLLSVALAVLFLALLAAAAGMMWWWQTRPQRGGPVIITKVPEKEVDPDALPRARITSFELTDQEGRPFKSDDMDGAIWVANFFFSSCPNSCLRLNQEVQQLARQYAPRGVQFVSITVDPDTDTPQALAKYAQRFDAASDRWKFLTGDQKLIERIGIDLFKVSTGKQTHTDRIFVIGPDGKIDDSFYAFDPLQMRLARGTLDNLLRVQRERQAAQRKATSPSNDADRDNRSKQDDSGRPAGAATADPPAEGP